MDYITRLNNSLKPRHSLNYTILDLFAGCGGLALGFESVGFKTIGFEKDQDTAKTYANNLQGYCHQEELSQTSEYPEAQVIIGGPPCQPFSVGGISAVFTTPEMDFLSFWKPSIIAYNPTQNWLYLIEAVHSSGPMNEIRILELKWLTQNCSAKIIFVTAFLTKTDFRKWIMDIAWETEV